MTLDTTKPFETIRALVCRNPEVVCQRTFTNRSSTQTYQAERDGLVVEVMADCLGAPLAQWFFSLVAQRAFVFRLLGCLPTDLASAVAEMYVRHLKHTTAYDKFDEGRRGFEATVGQFVTRGLPVQAVLPAFPCKSCNREKAFSCLPDLGEVLALQQLALFCDEVKKVYSPGMEVWIVSDGHVFSDCVNVNDAEVDEYNAELKRLNQEFGSPSIRFFGLADIFGDKQPSLALASVPHPVDTVIDEKTDVYRRLLMSTCDVDDGLLARDIGTPHHPRLKLYLGFKKFMSSDLIQYKKQHRVSTLQFRRMISQVAFEMIKVCCHLVDVLTSATTRTPISWR